MSNTSLTRRGLLKSSAVAGAGLAVPTIFTASSASAFTNEPTGGSVTLGFNVPQSGPYADEGADELRAYEAPFPGPEYKMGPRAMPSHVPTLPDDPAVPANQRAWEFFGRCKKPLLCAFSDNDPVSAGGDRVFRERVPGAEGQPHVTIQGGGHFLQEGRAQELSEAIANFVKST